MQNQFLNLDYSMMPYYDKPPTCGYYKIEEKCWHSKHGQKDHSLQCGAGSFHLYNAEILPFTFSQIFQHQGQPESVQNTKYISRKSLVAAIVDQLVMTPALMQYWFAILTFAPKKTTKQNLQRYFHFGDVNMCTNTILIPNKNSFVWGLNAGLVPPTSEFLDSII